MSASLGSTAVRAVPNLGNQLQCVSYASREELAVVDVEDGWAEATDKQAFTLDPQKGAAIDGEANDWFGFRWSR